MPCQFQVHRIEISRINTHIYVLFFRFFPPIAYYKILSIVPYATQQGLVGYLFYLQQCVSAYAKLLLIYPPHPTSEVTAYQKHVWARVPTAGDPHSARVTSSRFQPTPRCSLGSCALAGWLHPEPQGAARWGSEVKWAARRNSTCPAQRSAHRVDVTSQHLPGLRNALC